MPTDQAASTLNEDVTTLITIKKLCEKYNLHPDLYISDGILKRDYEEPEGHFRTFTEEIREVSESDITVLQIVKELRKDYGGFLHLYDVPLPK